MFRVSRFGRPLPRAFYSASTEEVARALLGARLVHRRPDGDALARIVETEAYVAEDPANHAYRGPTRRNRSMFDWPGTLYVYRIHQVHCANVVTRRGEAVLLRAAEPVSPGLPSPTGPGRLCRALGIDIGHDGLDLTRSAIRLLPGPPPVEAVVRAPRVGVTKAAELPLRFALEGSRHVSRPRPWSTGPAQRSFAQL